VATCKKLHYFHYLIEKKYSSFFIFGRRHQSPPSFLVYEKIHISLFVLQKCGASDVLQQQFTFAMLSSSTYSVNLVKCTHINNEWLVFFEELKNLGVLNLLLKILRCSSRTSALKIKVDCAIFSSSIILDLKNKIKCFSVIFINSKKMLSVKHF
jgi:hypothetical protein